MSRLDVVLVLAAGCAVALVAAAVLSPELVPAAFAGLVVLTGSALLALFLDGRDGEFVWRPEITIGRARDDDDA